MIPNVFFKDKWKTEVSKMASTQNIITVNSSDHELKFELEVAESHSQRILQALTDHKETFLKMLLNVQMHLSNLTWLSLFLFVEPLIQKMKLLTANVTKNTNVAIFKDTQLKISIEVSEKQFFLQNLISKLKSKMTATSNLKWLKHFWFDGSQEH